MGCYIFKQEALIMEKRAVLIGLLLILQLVPLSSFATNPISVEAHIDLEISKEREATLSVENKTLFKIKKKVQFFKSKVIAAFKNASKLSKIAFIASATSVVFFLLIYSPISSLFFVFGSWALALTGIILGIVALIRKNSMTSENRKISKRLAWWSIIMPFLSSIAFFIFLLAYWYV